MLPPEKTAKCGGVVTSLVGFAIHGAVDEILIFHYNGKLGVVYA